MGRVFQVQWCKAIDLSLMLCCSLSHVRFFVTPWTAAHQASLSFTISPRVFSNSCPLSWWYHPTISSSVAPCSSCLQSLPASGSFPMSQFFTLGGQSTGAPALVSVFPMTIQSWFPLGLTGLILLPKGCYSWSYTWLLLLGRCYLRVNLKEWAGWGSSDSDFIRTLVLLIHQNLSPDKISCLHKYILALQEWLLWPARTCIERCHCLWILQLCIYSNTKLVYSLTEYLGNFQAIIKVLGKKSLRLMRFLLICIAFSKT